MIRYARHSAILILLVVGLAAGIGGRASSDKRRLKQRPYAQLTCPRAGASVSQQPSAQRAANYVGSRKCTECHEEEYAAWASSRHGKMIQSVREHPDVVIGKFETLPKDADFSRDDIVYTIGGKFKQRYMLRADNQRKPDCIIGNYQWNTQLQRWQPYTSYKDWYADGFVHDIKRVFTSRTCDGCHFVGFMSQQERVETDIHFVWIRRTFDVSAAQASCLAVLRWNRIDYGATAYINGRQVGYNEPTGPYFVLLSPGVLHPGKNEIVLKIPGAAGVRRSRSGQFLFPAGLICAATFCTRNRTTTPCLNRF